MDDLVREFIDETMESLGELDMDLVKLEQNPDNEELLGKVFRLMHTIKGTCGFIGLSRLERTAHAGENLLDHFRTTSEEVNETSFTLLFMCIDRVRYLASEVHKTGKEPAGDDNDIIDAIKADLAATGQGGPAHVSPAASDVTEKKMAEEGPVETAEVKTEPAATPEKTPEYLRVQMSVLEELINMVSELVLTRNQLLQQVRAEENSALKPPLQRLNRIVSDLQDSVMKTRMQPIGNAWSKLPRIVRDLSTEMKKKITLDMEGEETELDRQVLEMIRDPLTHMVRNSCDHGIETPAERTAAGKPEEGRINLRAYHEGGFIIIRIQDDGKGLNAERIAQKALEKDLVDAEKLEKMTDKQILSFIMRPGFSTAESITNVSGRGVGMDVVRANIEQIGGAIDMDSTPGKGTVFTVRIPLTLAIISALIVEIDNFRYAIPQINIQELVSLTDDGKELIEYINDKPVLRLRDRIIPLLNSTVLFDREKNSDEIINHEGEKQIAVMSRGSSHYGIVVDRIFDTEEVVIKSVSSVLKAADIFAGNTILGDGRVIMILDPAAIARRFNIEKDVAEAEVKDLNRNPAKILDQEKAAMLIFSAGSGVRKAIPLAMVSRLQVFPAEAITSSADRMVVQYNNRLMQLAYVAPDEQSLGSGNVTTLVLSDDRSESSMALVIESVEDIVEGTLDLNLSTSRPGILGSMIVDNRTVDVIEIAHFLGQSQENWFSALSHAHTPFVDTHLANVRTRDADEAENAAASNLSDRNKTQTVMRPANSTGGRPKVLVVDDSSFFRNMLRPILSAAGYDVTVSEDPVQAIRLHDEGQMFDIVLSDIEMPNMDGYEFVEKMREDTAWQHTPFIAITSHNTAADAEYGYKKGFDQYIGKLDKDELIRTMQNVRTGT